MNKIFYALVVALSIGLSSCVKDQLTGNGAYGDMVTLYITSPQRDVITTRGTATDGNTIDKQSVYVLIVSGKDDDAKILDWNRCASGDGSTFGVRLDDRKSACHAFVIANAHDIIEAQTASWTKGGTTLGEVRRALLSDALPSSGGVISQMPQQHPMTVDYALPDGLARGACIGTPEQPLEVIPATVQITIENRTSAGAFTLSGVTLCNAPEKGYVMPGMTSAFTTHHYGKDGNVSEMIAGATTVEAMPVTEPLFCYESAEANNTFVVLKAEYKGVAGYYRLDILTSDRKPRPLERGKHYKISVFKVQKVGYSTVDEAISNPASNDIIYVVDTDIDSYDIITNGVQYLGVSNSEYWMYNSNYINVYERIYNDPIMNRPGKREMTPFTVTVLTYTADPTWNEGRVTASAGIHLYNDDNTTITQSLSLPLPGDASSSVRRELKACFEDSFTEGALDISIGDLHKVIKIKRAKSIDLTGDQIALGSDITYVSVGVVPTYNTPGTEITSDPSAFSLGYSRDGADIFEGNCKLAVDFGKEVYLRFKNRFVSETKQDYCHGTLYAHHNNSSGRVKVDFTADPQGTVPFGDYSYGPAIAVTGAFWKNNERGERLVQMPQFSREIISYGGRWTAKVLVGRDFIRLGEWDSSLKFDAAQKCYPGDPEDRPIDNGGLIMEGADHIIRFRIGLTSTNTGAPRYGLVQLIYMDGKVMNNDYDPVKITCYMFIRQGEEADYVLTPGKTYTDMNGQTIIAPDVKFSPYALIDPKLGTSGSNLEDHTAITDEVRPVFAPYPTYVDYLFQWSGDRAFSPVAYKVLTNPDSPYSSEQPIAGWNPNYAPTEYKELCPEGYVTPPAQIGGTDIMNALSCKGPDLKYSYNDKALGNSYGYGIYLDGYLDRRFEVDGKPMIVDDLPEDPDAFLIIHNHAPYSYSWIEPSKYASGDRGDAYLGYVFFDPESLHSIYIPTTTTRSGNGYEPSMLVMDKRNNAFSPALWTRTESVDDPSSAMLVCLLPGNNEMKPSVMDYLPKSQAAPVRCIKDTSKP